MSLGLGMHACNLCTWKVEAGGLGVGRAVSAIREFPINKQIKKTWHTSCESQALFNHAFLFSLLQEKMSQQSLQ